MKHIVERRRPEIAKNNNNKETIQILCFLVESAGEAIQKPNEYRQEPPHKHIYVKVYIDKLTVRVVTEEKYGHLEIKTIHFMRNKNTTD